MKTFLRIVFGFIVLIVVVLVGISLFLKIYFTSEKIIAMAKPVIEDATGRSIHVGKADIGLFSGVVLKDISMKEEDGKTDFFTAKGFSLHYELFPLLEKRFICTSIALDSPKIRIVRGKDGSFNFDSIIKRISEKPGHEPSPEKTEGGGTLPLSITINEVSLRHALFQIKDLRGEFPDTYGNMDAKVSVSITPAGEIFFKGWANTQAKGTLDELVTRLDAKFKFDPKRVDVLAHASLDKWSVEAKGRIRDYQDQPKIKMDISSQELNIDEIMKRLDKVLGSSKGLEGAKKTTRPQKAEAIKGGLPIPKGLEAEGLITISSCIYKGVTAKDVEVSYVLKDDRLHILKKVGNVLNGSVNATLDADVSTPSVPFQVTTKINTVNLPGLLAIYIPQAQKYLTGEFSCDIRGSGPAMPSEKLVQNLTLRGNYGIFNGEIRENPVSSAIASLLKMEELRTLKFHTIKGNLNMEKGWVIFKSKLTGKDANATVESGRVSVKGEMSVPLTLVLSRTLSKKLVTRQRLLKYLLDEDGRAKLPITIKGTYLRPRPTLNTQHIKAKAKKAVKERVGKEIEKLLSF